jgi:dihydrofolate reductase
MKLFSVSSPLLFLKILATVFCLPLIVACGSDGNPLPPPPPLPKEYHWVEVTDAAQFSARSYHTSVVFDDGTGEKMWVIGGQGSNNTYKKDVWHSTNGVTWKQATATAAFSARNSHTSVVFDNKMWVIGGFDGSGGTSSKNDVWSSTNGITWTEVRANGAASGFSARYSHTSVVFDDGAGKKMWVIAGRDSRSLNDIWHSTNGATWTKATNSEKFSDRYSHTSVVFNDGDSTKMWVIGGYSGKFSKNDVWNSTNGITWTEATNSAKFSGRETHQSVVFNDNDGAKMWVIGGDSAAGRLNDVWNSAEGNSWTEVKKPNDANGFNKRDSHQSVVFDNKIWVIGGFTGNHLNDVWHYVEKEK